MRSAPQTQSGREFDLLVTSCRFAFRGGCGIGADAAGHAVDWDRVTRLASRHRIEALVWNFLAATGSAPADGAAAGRLASRAAEIVAENLRSVHQCADLGDSMKRAGIPHIFVKGLTLGKLAYADPFLKMSADIDILVPEEAVDSAASVLKYLGYRLVVPSVAVPSPNFTAWHVRRKESVWRRDNGLSVELHSRLADNRRMIAAVGLESPRQLVEIANGISLPTLATEELFAYLCIHGASSAWFRLKWIADLAGLLHNCAPPEITCLHDRAVELGTGKAASQALLLAARLFDTQLEQTLQERLEANRTNRRLAQLALRALHSAPEPTGSLVGTWPIHLTQFWLLPDPLFKLSELRRQLVDSVRG